MGAIYGYGLLRNFCRHDRLQQSQDTCCNGRRINAFTGQESSLRFFCTSSHTSFTFLLVGKMSQEA